MTISDDDMQHLHTPHTPHTFSVTCAEVLRCPASNRRVGEMCIKQTLQRALMRQKNVWGWTAVLDIKTVLCSMLLCQLQCKRLQFENCHNNCYCTISTCFDYSIITLFMAIFRHTCFFCLNVTTDRTLGVSLNLWCASYSRNPPPPPPSNSAAVNKCSASLIQKICWL